jgi:hypothetical protein
MKTLTIAAVTAITAMFAVDYASAQERSGLDEKTKKEIREMIRKEIQAARRDQARSKARLKAESKPQPTIRPKSVTFLHRRPLTLVGGSPAARAIAGAKRAVETDKSLTKKQRVAALKALETAGKAVGGDKVKAVTPKSGLFFQRLVPSQDTLKVVPFRSDLFFDGSKKKKVDTEIFFSTDRGVITVPEVRFLKPNPLRIDPVLLKDMPGVHFIQVLGSEKDAKSQSKRKKI